MVLIVIDKEEDFEGVNKELIDEKALGHLGILQVKHGKRDSQKLQD